ncbi:MAG: M48 family metallopeptidase [Betaproteobacteria bacterium]|nr:M48 family metallopeptidase [Betaproteobacteria bacterium]
MRALLFCLGLLLSPIVGADTPAPTPPPPAAPQAAASAGSKMAVQTAKLDPVAATREYMNRLTGEKRAKSNAYFEGRYWLLLWNLVYGLAVAWLLLASRVSARVRDAIERKVNQPSVRVLLYALFYLAIVTLLSLPLTLYEDFFREHQYGLSNLSLVAFLGEAATGLLVNLVLGGVAITGLYALLRRLPNTWWAWGTLAGCGFIMLVIMVAPVFIAPLFNTYKPLPDGPLRDDILAMARANNIPADNVYWFDASKQTTRISANVSGLFGTTRISLNDNLLNRTSPAEIRAVMGHEMGHYVLNHVQKSVIFLSLVLLGGMLFLRFGWAWAHARFGARFGVRDISDPAGLPLLAALFSVYFFFATPVTNTITRVQEIEADYFGLNASREPDGFAEAIFKLSEYRKLEPAPLEEALFYTHPSGYNRILAAMRWKAEVMK